jgi:hypothetical protein
VLINSILKDPVVETSASIKDFQGDGNQLCYNGSATCKGAQFRQLLQEAKDSFSICKKDSMSISDLLNNTYDLNERKPSIADYPQSDFYVVAFWAKFYGGVRGYKETVKWMEDEIMRNSITSKMVTFIKVNTDLQDSWGLVSGEKARLHMKLRGKHARLEISDLPEKK